MAKLQCVWGEKVGTEEDHARCPSTAVGVVAVKDGRTVHPLALCFVHRMAVMAETNAL